MSTVTLSSCGSGFEKGMSVCTCETLHRINHAQVQSLSGPGQQQPRRPSPTGPGGVPCCMGRSRTGPLGPFPGSGVLPAPLSRPVTGAPYSLCELELKVVAPETGL